MLQLHSRHTKAVALLTGGVLMASALATTSAPAHAADNNKEKLYKGGAVALGVLGGYWILKGKTLPGAAAAAGAYYAYKKGKDEGDRYSSNSDGNVYPDERVATNTTNRRNERVANSTYTGDYTNRTNSQGAYPEYRSPDDYGTSSINGTANSTGIVLK